MNGPTPEGLIPGTSVLHNLLGITDPDQLARTEADIVGPRIAALLDDPSLATGDFDRQHMQAIHAYLFDGIYDWAGQTRSHPGRLTKGGPRLSDIRTGRFLEPDADWTAQPYDYYPGGAEMLRHFDQAVKNLSSQCSALPESPNADEFSSAIADPWGEMNVAHLFREGNTRTQLVFFQQLAQHHGLSLDLAAFNTEQTRKEFLAARYLHQATCSPDLLAQVINDNTHPIPEESALSATNERQRKPMERDQILTMLTELGAELDAQGLSTNIQVVGGAAMALTFSQMRVTEDVDAVVDNRTVEFEQAATAVAQRHGVADDWISDDVSDFVSRSPEGDQTLIALPGVNVYVASAEHLLAMKVRAATTRMTPRDRGDLVVLADHLGLGDAHEVADLTERQFSGVYRESVGRDEYVATVTEAFLQDDIEKGRDPMVRWEASQAREAEQRSSSGQGSEYDFDF